MLHYGKEHIDVNVIKTARNRFTRRWNPDMSIGIVSLKLTIGLESIDPTRYVNPLLMLFLVTNSESSAIYVQ